MKDLPYFKFYVNEWIIGDISLMTMEAQGVFINICSYYWGNECKMTLKKLQKRFKGHETVIDELIEDDVIKLKEGVVSINFLDQQVDEREKLSKTNSVNGKKGGRPKKSEKNRPLSDEKPTAFKNESESKAKKSNKEERRGEEKREDNNSAGAFSNQPLSPNDYFKCADDVFREYCKRDENTVRLTTKGEALYKAIHSVESRVQPVTVIDEVITFWRELQISEDFKIKKAYDLRRYLLNTVKKRIKDKYAEVDAIREKERRKYPVNSNQPGM